MYSQGRISAEGYLYIHREDEKEHPMKCPFNVDLQCGHHCPHFEKIKFILDTYKLTICHGKSWCFDKNYFNDERKKRLTNKVVFPIEK